MSHNLESVRATVDVPPIIIVKPGKETVKVEIRTELKNGGSESVVVHTPASSVAHFCHIMNDEHYENRS